MIWSPQQDAALLAVKRWLAEPAGSRKPFFYLAGLGGTGKSVIASAIAQDFGGRVRFGAFSGKAAAIMRAKGCVGATTIHRMIYAPQNRSMRKLHDLHAALARARQTVPPDGAWVTGLERDVAEEEKRHRQPRFDLTASKESVEADLIILDECSSVSAELGSDVLSLGVPVLVLGDPEQLPPVAGCGFFTNGAPDVMLTEIHRQAQDSPIIRMASIVREGGRLELGDYGAGAELCQVLATPPGPDAVLEFDQILCGTNAKRRAINARVRELLGRKSTTPEVGDRVVCKRNNHRVGILNGEMWSVLSARADGDDVLMSLRAEPLHGTPQADALPEDLMELDVVAHAAPFRGEVVSATVRMDAEEFDFGFAMTTHAFQGSQAPSILVFDQSAVFKQDARRWLYTALTRASERVTVVRA